MTQTDQWNAKRHSYPFPNTEFLFVTYFGCFGNELEDLSREMCPISQNKYRRRCSDNRISLVLSQLAKNIRNVPRPFFRNSPRQSGILEKVSRAHAQQPY